MCTRMQNDHLRTLTILQSMSEFSGLWRRKKKKKKKGGEKKACTKSVRAFRVLTLHTTRKKKQKNESKKLHK